MTERKAIELIPLFDHILGSCESWKVEEIIPNISKLGNSIVKQLHDKFSGDKYRYDRNHVIAYFDAIERFKDMGLPMTLEHFKQITNTTREKISPYPLYSGIKVNIPDI